MTATAETSEMSSDTLSLPLKPNAPIAYHYVKSNGTAVSGELPLVVFLNGLGLPQAAWLPVVSDIIKIRGTAGLPYPTMITYDRYGQGMTKARDPNDEGKEEGYGHDAMEVVHDLKAFLDAALIRISETERPMVFIANSIGCPVARLFCREYPGRVCGLIFLDTNPANSDFVSILPDPDAPDFDEESLPQGVKSFMLRVARAQIGMAFHPSVKNPESFDRRNIRDYLPDAGAPKLIGPNGNPPHLIVVGHDPEYFANEMETGRLKVPRILTITYVNPFWHKYNADMLQLSDQKRATGPVIAKNCGHFIQHDDPSLVANLANQILQSIGNEP